MPFSLSRLILAAAFVLATAVSPSAADRLAEARELVNAMGCKGCHAFGGRGGTLGPDLEKVGKRLSREQLMRQLVEPRVKNPASSMPSYDHLSADRLELLVDYLSRLH